MKNGEYYIGSTDNLEKRLVKHNSGGVLSTKFYRPWKVVFSQESNSLPEARRRELQLKSWKKRVALERLIKQFNKSRIRDSVGIGKGGDKGGEVVFAGTPKEIKKNKNSYTGKYL